ncbi:hypothetical protein K469DRAFT_689519 [Zopfia rhizophila CBS 207.26]|uniref:Uncharacterized protein n=1 Tax=Zopfia rhizophila CBS 207.26 TaxID=1314779 RepID=A0A6A6DX78_9PEZI|nr:hypothetical protein K469DRAFT_689519 [Zopfia rhizophila CBS 207.26]
MTDSISPLSRRELEDAITKYAPIIRVHPNEKYQMCSVEWFLKHVTLIDTNSPATAIVHPAVDQLPQGPQQGKRYYFTLEESGKGGNIATAKAYVHAFWQKDLSYTDIQFWFFSAYNGPGTARIATKAFGAVVHSGDVDLAPLGEHVGDWEYCTIRIENRTKEMIGIILSQHGSGIRYDRKGIEKFKMVNGTHPVVYSSRNGHANFASVDDNFTETRRYGPDFAQLEFDLLNTTADGGDSLDCSQKFEIISAEWITGPDAYTIPAWVNYPYRWGPEGTSTSMSTTTVANILKAAFGPIIVPVSDSIVTQLASSIIQVFVKDDINGAGAPCGQGPWTGHYD